MVLEVVFFSLAGWRLGLEARCVRGARIGSQMDRATQQGKTATLFGFPMGAHGHPSLPTTAPQPQWLAIQESTTGQVHEILVDGPVELITLPAAAIYPVPPLLAARTRLRGLRALVLEEALEGHPGGEKIAFLLDATGLVDLDFYGVFVA